MLIRSIFLIFVALSLLLGFSCSSDKPALTEKQSEGPPGHGANKAIPEQAGAGSLSQDDTGTVSPSGNTPPVITKAGIKLSSENNVDLLKVIPEGSDPDGDQVSFGCEWLKNGEPAGSGDSASGFRRGDKVSVKVTPFDGKEYGQPRVVTTEIKNTSPKIVQQGDVAFDGKLLTCQVSAVDPDGDALTYELSDGPKGMTINKESGMITWKPGPDPKDKHAVRVKIADGQGAEILHEFSLDLGGTSTKSARPGQ